MRALVAACVVVFACACMPAQQGPHPALLLDNSDVRVLRVTIPDSRLHPSTNVDRVFLVLDPNAPAGSIATFSSINQPEQPGTKTGEPQEALRIEIKKHWDAPVRACAAPMTCERQVKAGGLTVGESVTLFSNGFITGAVHRLDRGATLDSSYYSAKGVDRILFVPLTPLQANFGGVDVDLKPGQPYFSSATQVEVSADTTSARWFVLRLNLPKAAADSKSPLI